MASLTLLMVTGNCMTADAQTPTFLTGQKTGDYFGGTLISLGNGSATISNPISRYTTPNVFPLPDTYRFFYGDNTLLTGSTTVPTKLRAVQDVGIAGVVGAGANIYLQIRNTGNATLAGGTTTYIKLKEKPVLNGISVAVLGLIGIVETQGITGQGYSGAANYAFNSAGIGYNGSPNEGSSVGTTSTHVVLDKLGEWYALVRPVADYNSIRLNVSLPSDLRVADVAHSLEVNVYNAFTQTASTCSSRAQFTDAGTATGITINSGAAVGGLELSQLIANPQYAIDGNSSRYSSFSSGLAGVGVASTISQTFFFDHTGTATDGISFRMGLPQALVDLALLGNGITFKVYNNESLVSTQTLGSNILDLNLLNLLSLGAGYREMNVTVNPNVAFNRVVVELNAGLLNLGVAGDALRMYDVSMTAAKPTFTVGVSSQNVSVCYGNTAALRATTDSGNELLWYNSLSSTSPVVQSATAPFVTPSLIANTIYYVASRKIGCTLESERVPINVTVLSLPTITLGAMPSACVETSTASLPYTATTQSPTTYSIVWDPLLPGTFLPVTDQSLPAAAIPIHFPATATAGAYSGILYVKNATCTSAGLAFHVTLLPKPNTPPITPQAIN
ncbi:immunoglobulin domain-containing protein [Pedobacter duraquae]|nr:hypothetical protein [Pedobacter duraquae]